MKLYIKIICLIFFLFYYDKSLFGVLKFANQNSKICIETGSILGINNSISNWQGSLERQAGAIIHGSSITFSNGILTDLGTDSKLTGIFNPTGNQQILLYGNQTLNANPGICVNKLNIFGNNNTIQGSPQFNNSDAIRLEHCNSSLTLALQNILNSNITLRGGTLFLANDLKLSDDRTLTGSGTVSLNRNSLSFGSQSDLKLTHTILWNNATDINLNGRTSLSGIWTFTGSNSLNGHGNILDLTNGGTLYVARDTTLYLTDITVKGIGIDKGWFVLQSPTSRITLSNVTIEMDNRFTVTMGGILVDGPSTVIHKNYNLLFDNAGTLSIDGVILWKNAAAYAGTANEGNILFTDTVGQKNKTLLNDGAIDIWVAGVYVKNNSNAIKYLADHFITLGDAKLYTINNLTESKVIDGHGKLSGSINLSGDTLTINKDLNLGNQTSINSSGNFDLQNNALILDGNLTIPPDSVIKITSSGIIDGQDNMLEISANAKLIIDDNVTLTLRNLNMVGQASPQIEMRSNSSALALQNTTLNFDQDFTLSQGKLFIQDEVCFTGTNKFSYASTSTAYIAPHSTLYFDANTTFSYSPRLTSQHSLSEKNLIKFADKTSCIFFNECTLQLPDSGWQITNGTIFFDNKVKIYSGTNQANSFEFGNGTLDDEPHVIILSDANIENYGYIYANFVN